MPAPSQKNLPISFVLDDGDGLVSELALPIRPEDLTRTEPSRVSVTNTIDGAYIDSFGRGVANIAINGHTGWGSAARPDGAKKFAELRDDYIHRWHILREDRVREGRDPDAVRLLFADTLNNNYVGVVVPQVFTLKRSKNNPLLMYYSINLLVVDDKAANPSTPQEDESWRNVGNGMPFGFVSPASAASLSSSIDRIGSLSAGMNSAISGIGALGVQVKAATDGALLPIMTMARNVTGFAAQVNGVVNAGAGVVLGVAGQISKAGEALWGAVGAVESIPLNLKARVMQIRSEFSNAFCILKGATRGNGAAWDFSDFFGSSNCSSTSGGRPMSVLASVNGFESFNAATPQAFSFDQPAIDSLRFLGALDQAAAQPAGLMLSSARSIQQGVSFGR